MTENFVVKLDPHNAVQEAKKRNLNIPLVASDRLATLADAKGIQYGNMMANQTDKEFDEFIETASRPEAKVLEIGAAYGSPYLLKAYERDTPAEYTAIDILPDQLKILARRIDELYPSDPSKLSRLTLIGGAFPGKEVVNELQESGYDAILASRVFHFFTEEEIVEAFRQVHRLLKPGGKLFVKIGTPYNNLLDPDFKENMANDIKNFLNSGNLKKRPFPGFIENTRAVMNKAIEEKVLKNLGIGERHGFLCDKEIMKLILGSTGFKIELCEYSPSHTYPSKCDGREYLIAIAQRMSDH